MPSFSGILPYLKLLRKLLTPIRTNKNMTKYLDIFTAFGLVTILVALPLYIAALAGENTRIGVLSYVYTNNQKTALRF
jgi:hypothetical protein